jgi:hypothetical protein
MCRLRLPWLAASPLTLRCRLPPDVAICKYPAIRPQTRARLWDMRKVAPLSGFSGRPRRSGIRVDPDRLDFELGRRGLTARQLSELAKVHEVTLSRARHGRPVAERTLRRITQALVGSPPLVGADLLLAEPENKKAAASSSLEGWLSSVTGQPTKTAESPEVDTHWSASGGSPPVMTSPIDQTGLASNGDDGTQQVAT